MPTLDRFMSGQCTTDEAPWRAGLRGARANLWSGVALQMVALALVLAYYHHDATRTTLTALADFRGRSGILFGVLSTGIFGGLIPFLFLRLRPVTAGRYSWTQGAALTAFWSYKGLEIDLFYRFLARVVGEGVDVATVATKMFIDQFIYCPLLAVPPTVLLYAWVETRFATRAIVADVKVARWYRRRVLPVLISNLGVWVPAVCIIYALPTPLQLPLQNLVLCFFTLLLAHMSAESTIGKPKAR